MNRERLFSVLPMSQRISLQGGETYTGSIKIAVPSKATDDFNYLVTVTPYNVIGTNYEADLSTQNIYTELSDWITIEDPTGTVSPNQTVTVNYTIKVPEDAHAGGQYATIMVSSDPTIEEAEGISVANRFQLASVIYADVSGEIRRDGEVTANEIPDFSFGAPLTLGATIENRGNVHQDAYFTITVTDAFTGNVIISGEGVEDAENVGDAEEEASADVAVAPAGGGTFTELIMPESTRYVTHEIGNLPMVGVVRVNQTVYFNDIPYAAEKELLICPAWLIFIVCFVIASGIIGLITGVRRHRKKKAAA